MQASIIFTWIRKKRRCFDLRKKSGKKNLENARKARKIGDKRSDMKTNQNVLSIHAELRPGGRTTLIPDLSINAV